jgi:hypothetical protein
MVWVSLIFPVRGQHGRQGLPREHGHRHAALRKGKPFPITTEQTLEVGRVISLVRQGTPFAN